MSSLVYVNKIKTKKINKYINLKSIETIEMINTHVTLTDWQTDTVWSVSVKPPALKLSLNNIKEWLTFLILFKENPLCVGTIKNPECTGTSVSMIMW